MRCANQVPSATVLLPLAGANLIIMAASHQECIVQRTSQSDSRFQGFRSYRVQQSYIPRTQRSRLSIGANPCESSYGPDQ